MYNRQPQGYKEDEKDLGDMQEFDSVQLNAAGKRALNCAMQREVGVVVVSSVASVTRDF